MDAHLGDNDIDVRMIYPKTAKGDERFSLQLCRGTYRSARRAS